MTALNLFQHADAGNLGRNTVQFTGYSMAAAIDASFEIQNVPLSVYDANSRAAAHRFDSECDAMDNLLRSIGAGVFGLATPENFRPLQLRFTNPAQMIGDLAVWHGSTILLETNAPLTPPNVGLKPFDNDPYKWQIVGVHQLKAVKSPDGPAEVRELIDPAPVTTDQVWDYLSEHNPRRQAGYTAWVFPPEPV